MKRKLETPSMRQQLRLAAFNLPEQVLETVDAYAEKTMSNRSQVLRRAVVEWLAATGLASYLAAPL